MDPKTEKKELQKLRKMKKSELKDLQLNLADELSFVRKKYKTTEASKNGLEKSLFDAIDAKDSVTTEIIKSKMSVLKDELERLSKREKSLTEELELASKAAKNDFDGKSGAWMTAGAWLIGITTTVLSGWGLRQSHKAFNDGTMVDKSTRGLAERLSGMLSFMNFKK